MPVQNNRELESAFEEYRRLRRVLNPFVVLQNVLQEDTHRRMMAWLLDPMGDHPLDTLMCRSLFGWEADVAAHDIKIRENVRQDGGGADRPDLVVVASNQLRVGVLEIKTQSPVDDYQLQRYHEWCEGSHPKANRSYVLLTKYGEQPKHSAWRSLCYGWIVDLIRPFTTGDTRAAEFLGNYADALSRWFQVSGTTTSQRAGFRVLDLLDGSTDRLPTEWKSKYPKDVERLKDLEKHPQRKGAPACLQVCVSDRSCLTA